MARIKHFGRSKPLLKKTTFRSPKSCFFLSLWVRIKHVEGSNFWKKQLFGAEKLFFNLQLEGSPFAVALWAAGKGTWKASCLLPRVSGRENEKTTFRGLKSCFLICNLEGSPFAVALWAAGKGTWKASCLLPRVSGRENEKTTFRGLKSCFF